MRDGRVDVERLARDLLLPRRRQKFQRAHVVQAVGQFDEHDADVVHHGQHHLAHVLGLRLFRRGEVDLADLGDALDDVRDLLAELGLDLVDGDRGVFDRIVQQSGGDGRGVELHLGQDGRDLQRMRQVRLAGLARLPLVMLLGKLVGLFDGREIVGGAVGANLAQQIAKAGDRQNIGRDLLAQSRHNRLYAEKFSCAARRASRAICDQHGCARCEKDPLPIEPIMSTIVPIMSAKRGPSRSGASLFGQTRTALLAILFGHTSQSFHLRQLARTVGTGNGAVQRELKHLAALGLVVRREQGNQVLYQANAQSPIFPEIKSLVAKSIGVHDVLKAALARFEHEVAVAFVYGSIARQQERPDSDVDLMIVGKVGFSEVVSALRSAQKTLGREINPTVFPAAEFRSKLVSGNHFLRTVMKDKKLFILGSPGELAKLAEK